MNPHALFQVPFVRIHWPIASSRILVYSSTGVGAPTWAWAWSKVNFVVVLCFLVRF